jgi:lipopolysaccharide/colanic/teichoic acid biosynthesis glycosyltransferase
MPKTAQASALTAMVSHVAGGSLPGATIGIWGFSRDAVPDPIALAFIDSVVAEGAFVQVFDPCIDTTMTGLDVVLDAYDAARGADVLVTFNRSDEFDGVDLDEVREIMASPAIVDATEESGFAGMGALGFSYSTPTSLLVHPRGTLSHGLRGSTERRGSRLSFSKTMEEQERAFGDVASTWIDWKIPRHGSEHGLEAKGLGAKRAFDLIIGTPLALAALPLIGLFAIGMAISLRCWPFFTQWRTGRNGERFRFLKIRTLPPHTPAYAHKFNLDTDNLPKLARFLRKQHLDELPQLLLVPLGKMSLVGPRPKMPDDKEPIEPTFGRLRTTVPQGCTGLWQIGEHAHLRVCDSAHYDYAYLRHGGVVLDIWILWRTVLLLIGRNTPVSLQIESSIPRWARGRGFVSADVVPVMEPIAA